MSYEDLLEVPVDHRLLILSPESPDPGVSSVFDAVAVRIRRAEVERCDPRNAERALRRLLHDRDTVIRFQRSLVFLAEEYAADPRELYESPQVRKYYASLDLRFPYLFHFLPTDRLAQLIAWLSPGHHDGLPDSRKVRHTVRTHLHAMERLHRRFGVPREATADLTENIRALVEERFGSLMSEPMSWAQPRTNCA